MKSVASMLALALAFAMTGPAFAEDVTKAMTETDCDKAGGVWNAQSNECAEESAEMGKEEGTHEGHAVAPENDKLLQVVTQAAECPLSDWSIIDKRVRQLHRDREPRREEMWPPPP